MGAGAHRSWDISVRRHIGNETYRSGDTSVLGHIGAGTYQYWDISVQGHIGTGTCRYGDISVRGHISTGTYRCGDIPVRAHVGLYPDKVTVPQVVPKTQKSKHKMDSILNKRSKQTKGFSGAHSKAKMYQLLAQEPL